VEISIQAVSPESIFRIVVPPVAAFTTGAESCAVAAGGLITSMQTSTAKMNQNLPFISESSLLFNFYPTPSRSYFTTLQQHLPYLVASDMPLLCHGNAISITLILLF
jgi:hypothetical protein